MRTLDFERHVNYADYDGQHDIPWAPNSTTRVRSCEFSCPRWLLCALACRCLVAVVPSRLPVPESRRQILEPALLAVTDRSNQLCEWRLRAPPGHVVVVSFPRFAVASLQSVLQSQVRALSLLALRCAADSRPHGDLRSVYRPRTSRFLSTRPLTTATILWSSTMGQTML